MADPQKGMRDYRLAAENAAKDIDKIAERIRASLSKSHDKLGSEFNAEMRAMVSYWKQGTREMDISLGTLPKSMERAFAQMGAVTDRGGKKFLNLRKAIEGVGTFMPKALGINAFAILQGTVENAARMDAEFVAKHAAIGTRSEAIVRAFTGEGDAAKRTFDIIQSGRQYTLVAAVETYKQEVAQARGSSDAIAAARSKLATTVIDLDKRTQRERNRAALSEAGKMQADAAARRVSGGARQVMAATTGGPLGLDLPGLLQRSKGVAELAAAEKKVTAARQEGKSASLSLGQAINSELLGAVTKLTAGITPMTVFAQILMQVMTAFDNVKISGATALSAVAAQGPLTAAEGGFSGIATQMVAVGEATQDLRTDLMGVSAETIDRLNIASAGAARTMGGLGKDAIPSIIAGLSAVQVMAPLAGMDASSAMALVVKGQKAFGLKNREDIVGYFNSIRGGARAAGMSVDDFMSSVGDINQMGMIFGLSIDQMVGKTGALTKALAGMAPGGSSALRGMLGGAIMGLSNQSISRMISMQMVGGAASSAQAFARLTDPRRNPINTNLDAFRHMMAALHLANPRTEDQRLKTSIFMEKQFGTPFAMMLARHKDIQESFLTGSRSIDEVKKALGRAGEDTNALKNAAEIASSQLTTLEQIQKTLESFMQAILTSTFFRLGSNPARDAAVGRSNALTQTLLGAK